ncbi:SusD/RagB family nutrient-binding outer membrane lipoprotein [Bacteroides sp. 519]|uniref:SusD/RagB family nutrient-binding outer membrane lipoprotein n=1 Tax=Bacteroides sp. 519 TaxID=2302937 RepID=UPI0013D31B27|nr:SusD/RagB family nutrient-binding outer membrane lipoprotein [Bacteroides sp. 519]NDV57548.1 SusD/RagB family nutrient-binding outer membrane lipoprotein [Bacteroides sp. 519]
MKNIFSLLLGLMMVCGFSACSDDDYTKKYANPGQTATVSCEKLMTGVFFTGAQYTYNSYWRMWTWENNGLSKYAQTIGFTNSEGSVYSINDSYANDRWINFYKVLTQFRVLQNTYDKLTDEGKTTFRVFSILSEIFVYDHLSQVIDVFGDVPFSTAGYLAITGDVVTSYPSYDNAADLYTMMLDNLGTLYTELKSLSSSMSSLTTSYLTAQDFINGGDLTKWMKYCNSLRLRLATRVASQGTLASKGQSVINEILSNNYPLVEQLTENIQVLSDDSDASSTADPAGLNYGDAFFDGFKDHSRANQAMLDVMLTKEELGENDPRLVVMYSTNAKGEYKGYSTHETYDEQVTNTSGIAESERVYSRIDSTTVIYNRNMKSPIITAAEVNLMKAEAYQKGWANGDAKQAFVDGVLESVKFYYDQNNEAVNTFLTTSPIKKVEMPNESDIIAFAEKMWDKAANKEEIIGIQKWLNFGFLQGGQAWNEVRRTGYPSLYCPSDPTAQVLKETPNRVMYPNSERSYNTAKYQEQVQTMPDGDSYYTKLFWAK